MEEFLLNELQKKQIINDQQKKIIVDYEKNKLFSAHWELKACLYVGILMLNAGLAWLIYQNIDSIGHQAVIAGIAAITIFCFWYSFKHIQPFSKFEIKSTSPFSSYILLLGCLTFLILEGYLQFQYNIFGTQYGLATFLPVIVFFPIAYLFDHRGILSMAITAFASWLGVTVSPAAIFNNGLEQNNLIYTGLLLGILLCTAAYLSHKYDFKKHFNFTFLNFGGNILFIAALSGLIFLENYLVFFPIIILFSVAFIKYAINSGSFYFFTVPVIYAYWALSYLILQIPAFQSILILYYFIISSIILIVFLIKYREIMKLKSKIVPQNFNPPHDSI